MKGLAALVAVFAPAALVFGHHSDAGLDMENAIVLDGTVTGYYWRNPHAYFTMETTEVAGGAVEWELQMGSTITMQRRGWARDTLVVGDRVTVELHPAINGRP